jgi:hypothetical protein
MARLLVLPVGDGAKEKAPRELSLETRELVSALVRVVQLNVFLPRGAAGDSAAVVEAGGVDWDDRAPLSSAETVVAR